MPSRWLLVIYPSSQNMCMLREYYFEGNLNSLVCVCVLLFQIFFWKLKNLINISVAPIHGSIHRCKPHVTKCMVMMKAYLRQIIVSLHVVFFSLMKFTLTAKHAIQPLLRNSSDNDHNIWWYYEDFPHFYYLLMKWVWPCLLTPMLN